MAKAKKKTKKVVRASKGVYVDVTKKKAKKKAVKKVTKKVTKKKAVKPRVIKTKAQLEKATADVIEVLQDSALAAASVVDTAQDEEGEADIAPADIDQVDEDFF